MAFYSGSKLNKNLVFGNNGEIGNISFPNSGDNIVASNEIKIAQGVAQFFRIAVDNGKIIGGAPQDSTNGTNAGAAYIYDLDGTNQIKITASDGAASDFFGSE